MNFTFPVDIVTALQYDVGMASSSVDLISIQQGVGKLKSYCTVYMRRESEILAERRK